MKKDRHDTQSGSFTLHTCELALIIATQGCDDFHQVSSLQQEGCFPYCGAIQCWRCWLPEGVLELAGVVSSLYISIEISVEMNRGNLKITYYIIYIYR